MLIFREWGRTAFINIKTLKSYMTGQLSFVSWRNIFPEYKTVRVYGNSTVKFAVGNCGKFRSALLTVELLQS
jgi:hypothetical protein